MAHSGCPMPLFSFHHLALLLHTQMLPMNLRVLLAFISLSGSYWPSSCCKLIDLYSTVRNLTLNLPMSSIASLRKNIGLVVLFGFLTITFLLLAVGSFTGSLGYVYFSLWVNGPFLTLLGRTTKAGGAMGAITAFVAYYVGLSELVSSDGIHLPLIKLAKQD